LILLCGIPSENAIAMVREQLKELGVVHVMLNQRRFANIELEFKIAIGQVTGMLQIEGSTFRLQDFQAIYTRLMDFRYLPELDNEPPDSPKRSYCRALHGTLIQWLQIAQARVISRPDALGSNFSKPYQAQLILKHGFKIPETLITNDPKLVHDFYKKHNRVIYKSISSVRSIVQTLTDKDLERLDHIQWCPTQFQEFIEGSNVRVHVVGDEVFATTVSSKATDYRYGYRIGEQTELKAVELGELSEKCVELSHALGLGVSGIDLKITPNNEVFCFEVNPSPAFSYYEDATGQPIARSIAAYLANA
jgi:glutathione synthase/RimK-type ligase-like ATP-grasp enzyme